ncbi:spermidine synthase [Conexibacter sp. S30A1]|uniref:spermidine synthase n=1 Tax=Conexibacter sp. S30A1 TaxID=2937800 RepID=UPI00200CB9F4|nr:fused MFS/spermidine synthase [Conexibacter sp. S30A1]
MSRSDRVLISTVGELSVLADPDRPSGRLLRQDDMDASYVDLADSSHLEFDYLRWMRLVLRAAGARRVIHLGGGACTLARALLADDPGSRQRVYELDARVLELARAHMGLRRQPGLRVQVGDGRGALDGLADASGDAIVIDAFTGARVPRHLVTVEALRDCARVAALTLVNVVDTAGLADARAIAAGLAEAYPAVAALAGPKRRGNIVLFAAASMPDLAGIESRAAGDRSPARLVRGGELAGAGAWRDR